MRTALIDADGNDSKVATADPTANADSSSSYAVFHSIVHGISLKEQTSLCNQRLLICDPRASAGLRRLPLANQQDDSL